MVPYPPFLSITCLLTLLKCLILRCLVRLSSLFSEKHSERLTGQAVGLGRLGRVGLFGKHGKGTKGGQGTEATGKNGEEGTSKGEARPPVRNLLQATEGRQLWLALCFSMSGPGN